MRQAQIIVMVLVAVAMIALDLVLAYAGEPQKGLLALGWVAVAALWIVLAHLDRVISPGPWYPVRLVLWCLGFGLAGKIGSRCMRLADWLRDGVKGRSR